jgi:hypothetical protein
MPLTIDPGDVIAGLALALSGYATWKTFKFNERQRSLIESQKKLNAILLEKGEDEAVASKKADLGASFVKIGSAKYKLKIWNKGKAAARNVSIDFPEGNEVLVKSEVNEKFPLEVLDTFQAVELIAAVTLGTKRKHAIRLTWADDFSENNEKTVYPTI